MSREYEAVLLVAIESSGLTPEEFGEVLATATAPPNLDSPREQARQASCRGRIVECVGGLQILHVEDMARIDPDKPYKPYRQSV